MKKKSKKSWAEVGRDLTLLHYASGEPEGCTHSVNGKPCGRTIEENAELSIYANPYLCTDHRLNRTP